LVGAEQDADACCDDGREVHARGREGRVVGETELAHVGTATAATWDVLKTKAFNTFGDIVALNYSNMSRYGYLVNKPRSSYAGLLVDESRSNLAELAAYEDAESPEGDVP